MLRSTFALKLAHAPSRHGDSPPSGRHPHVHLVQSWSSPLNRAAMARRSRTPPNLALAPRDTSTMTPEVLEVESSSDDEADASPLAVRARAPRAAAAAAAIEAAADFSDAPALWSSSPPPPSLRRRPPLRARFAWPRAVASSPAHTAASSPAHAAASSPAHAAASNSVVAALRAAFAAESATTQCERINFVLRLERAEQETVGLRRRAAAAEAMASRGRKLRRETIVLVARGEVARTQADAIAAAAAAQAAAQLCAAAADSTARAAQRERDEAYRAVKRTIDANRKVADAVAHTEARARLEREGALKLCRQEVREKLRGKLIEALGASAVQRHAATAESGGAGDDGGAGLPSAWDPARLPPSPPRQWRSSAEAPSVAVAYCGGDGGGDGDDDDDGQWYEAQFSSELRVLSEARRVAVEIERLPMLHDDHDDGGHCSSSAARRRSAGVGAVSADGTASVAEAVGGGPAIASDAAYATGADAAGSVRRHSSPALFAAKGGGGMDDEDVAAAIEKAKMARRERRVSVMVSSVAVNDFR